MEWTQDQLGAFKWLDDWYKSGEPWACLSGAAGTGKTTTGYEWMRRRRDIRFLPTAPTHKAVAVIRDMCQAIGLADLCATTASAAGLILKDDDEERYLIRRGGPNPRFQNSDVVIVDEASMVGPKLWNPVTELAAEYGTRLLFIGDQYQLQPVKDGKHVAFNRSVVKSRYNLKQIVRQQEDNRMIQQASRMRKLIAGKSKDFKILFGESNGYGIHKLRGRDFANALIDAAMKADAKSIRGLTYTQEAALELSDQVRTAKFGDKANDGWQPGERIINLHHIKHGGLQLYSSQEAVVVESGEPEPHPDFPDFEATPVLLRPDGRGANFLCYEALNYAKAAKHAQDLAAQANTARYQEHDDDKAREKWREFWKFKESFSELISAYVCTIHRAQGSTFDAVYVDAGDITSFCRRTPIKMYRLFYVALSRARFSTFVKDTGL